MEKRTVKVKVSDIAQSPQKLRLVIDTVRGKEVGKALSILKFLNRKGTKLVSRALESGVANAMDRFQIEGGDMIISDIRVDVATTRKTGRFASRGRFSKILKRRSHLSLQLTEK